MNLEPQKFFVGLMDFFSILLPGALLTYLLMGELGPEVLADRYTKLEGAGAWAAFLFASYLLGHLVFLLGTWQDELYDWARRHTLNTQIAMLARRGRLLAGPARALIWLVFGDDRNLAVERAGRIKQHALRGLQAADAINTFQWCKALLTIESPASLATVQRFEADSKFFRCFAIVLLLVLMLWPFQHKWPLVGVPVVLLLLLLALWRYMDQRFKATKQAYWGVITLTAQSGKVSFDTPSSLTSGPSHAGGVVFRARRGEIQFLLVEAKRDPDQWLLPKGHIEQGEHPRETAVREVHEETGVWARILAELGEISFSSDGTPISVKYYLMEAAGRGLRSERTRQHAWLPLPDAVARASYNETRELLQSALNRIARRKPRSFWSRVRREPPSRRTPTSNY